MTAVDDINRERRYDDRPCEWLYQSAPAELFLAIVAVLVFRLRLKKMKQRSKRIYLIGLACLALLLSSCATGPQYVTRVLNGNQILYKVIDGHEHAVYKIDRSGKTTIYDPNDPKSQQLVMQSNPNPEAKPSKEQAKPAQKTQKTQRYQGLQKRSEHDPIYVAMFPTKVGPRIAKTEKSDGAVFKSIKQVLENDDVIVLLDQATVNRYLHQWQKNKNSDLKGLNEDVRVFTSIRLEDGPSLKSSSGKHGIGTYVHLEAKIVSRYLEKSFTVKSSADIYQNVQAIEELGTKIEEVVKKKIGPYIPKRKY